MTKLERLKQLSGLGILAQDLRLFLDVNPTDQAAIADFKRVVANYKNAIASYEQKYGPLTGGNDIDGTWASNPWPWHLDMGGNA